MPIEAIISLLVGGAVSAMFGMVQHNLKRMQETSDKRYRERIEGEILEMEYRNAADELTLHIADILHNADICNGDLDAEKEIVQACRAAYFKHINSVHMKNKIK